MLPFHRLRALIAAITAGLPTLVALPPPEEVAARCAALAAARSGMVTLRTIGHSRTGMPIQALRIGPVRVPAVLLLGAPRGDAPLGAATLLALAQHLAAHPALLDALGVTWWLAPCADPDGARANAPWYTAPPSLERYAQGVVSPHRAQSDDPAEATWPEVGALRRLIAEVTPAMILALYDVPIGGVALFAQGASAATGVPWAGRAGDFARLVDLLGLPLDRGGALGPLARASAPGCYTLPEAFAIQDTIEERLRRFGVGASIGAGLARLAGDTAADGPARTRVGGVVVPRFADYARRERDQMPSGWTRRAVTEGGIRLWREWFAFGRTALDLVQPLLARADGPLTRAVAAALGDGAAIMAEGGRWAGEMPRPDTPATIAEAFAAADAIRAARLPRLAALLRLLDAVCARLGPAAPDALIAARDRAAETRERWLDDLAASGDFRPIPLERAIGAQLGAILLALPTDR